MVKKLSLLATTTMRSIWKGALSFGLVNIPVRLYSATEESNLDLTMLHKKDMSPIRYAKVCRSEGVEIPYEEVIKGYEHEKGDYIVLSEDDFKKANVKKTNTIEIMDFVEESEIDSTFFEKPYYLEPDKASKPYSLLREALKQSKKVGIAKYVIRNREHIGIIKPHSKAIVLNQLRFAEEIRPLKGLDLPGEKDVSKKEIEMALRLIDQLVSAWKPEAYKDAYSEELKAVVEAKAKGKKPKSKGKAPELTPVSDLMDALRASLEERKTVKTKK